MARIKKLPPSKQAVSTDPPSSQLELLQRKYLLQNKTLAKANSVMLSKIALLESKISTLIADNMTLRRQNRDGSSYKRRLESDLSAIESAMWEKYQEMTLMFLRLRQQEGLLKQAPEKVPTHRERHRAFERLPLSSTLNALEQPQPSAMDAFQRPPPGVFDDSLVSTRKELSREDEPNEYEFDRSSYEVSDYMIPEGNEAIEQQGEITLFLSPKPALPVATSTAASRKNAFDPLLYTDRSFSVYSDDMDMESEGEVLVALEGEEEPGRAESNPEVVEDVVEVDRDVFEGGDDPLEENKDLPKMVEDVCEIVKDNRSSLPTDSSTPQSTELKVDTVLVSACTPSKRGRDRKPVNYALPSLRAKMRRPTAELVDAVVEPSPLLVIPAYKPKTDVVSPPPPVENAGRAPTRRAATERAATGSSTRGAATAVPVDRACAAARELERTPLKEVSRNDRRSTPAKPTAGPSSKQIIEETLEKMREAKPVEHSIFDFVDDPHQLYVDTSKSLLRKRTQTFGAKREKRRHSMLL